ncbi:hypothetical protein [Helicobacter typhlonius]|uniref:hypothetical protein n=1 Tax=Helicobacter typhlonius TaxID=76936 RepID=UPI003F6A1396
MSKISILIASSIAVVLGLLAVYLSTSKQKKQAENISVQDEHQKVQDEIQKLKEMQSII